jgi:phage shock protein A
MDHEQESIVDELREKVRMIIHKLDKTSEEKARLKQELEKLNHQIKQQETELETLKNKYSNLKVAKTMLAGNDDVHDARIKVNKIVREIDKCIALLNK